jgi:hypothetical protein
VRRRYRQTKVWEGQCILQIRLPNRDPSSRGAPAACRQPEECRRAADGGAHDVQATLRGGGEWEELGSGATGGPEEWLRL